MHPPNFCMRPTSSDQQQTVSESDSQLLFATGLIRCVDWYATIFYTDLFAVSFKRQTMGVPRSSTERRRQNNNICQLQH